MSMREKFKQRAKDNAQKGGAVALPEGTKRIEIKKGTKRLDVIPYVVTAENHPDEIKAGEEWARRPFLIHFGIGVNNKTVICPRTVGKPCPICEYYDREKKRPGSDEEALRDIKARRRELYNVIDLDNEDEGVQILEFSYFNFGKVLEAEINEADDDAIAGFADLKGGYTLKVRFSEAAMGTNKYLEATRIDFLEREDYKKSILKEVVDLDEAVSANVMSYSELEKLFLGDEAPDTDVDEDEPRGKRRRPADDDDEDERPKKPKKPADDDDEDERPTTRRRRPADDDEEDEKPSPKRKTKPAPADDEEEDERPKKRRAADDDEEEERPAPKRKSKPVDDDEEEDERPKKPKKPADDDDEDERPARSRGRKAPPVDDDEDDEKPAPKRKSKPADDEDEEERPKGKKASKSEECPLDNGEFGKTHNEFKECDDCDLWAACAKAAKAAAGKKKK